MADTDAGVGMGFTWAVNTAQCRPTPPAALLIGAISDGIGPPAEPAWGALKGRFAGKPDGL
ncbi:hypothetical protein ACWEQ5_20380 [Streptomyces griseoincarnatus]|uniref:Uncharacterized protein n=1 Tax=Streptomyces tunisiensis TaxID=948699 RepID=A0ABP7XLQ1_9ACTN|nr:hypothetical protein [Streptomyces sp. E1N211]AXI87119.1 hypothetical protein SAM9427_15560 [Streptomyces sp. ETH9427]